MARQTRGTRFFIKRCDTATNSLNGSANTVDVAEDLTAALDLQKPTVNDLRGQDTQTFLPLKIWIVWSSD
jgi:hypothetical protein